MFWSSLLVDGVFWCLNFYKKSHLESFSQKKQHFSTIFDIFYALLLIFCRILLACCKIVLEYFLLVLVYLCRGAHWWFAASVTVLSARCSWCSRVDVRTVVLTGQGSWGQLTLVEQVSQSNCWHNSGRDFVHAGRVASICVAGADLCVVFF